MHQPDQIPQKLHREAIDDQHAWWSRIGWWVAGVLIGIAVVGPAWSGDALLNLDLVVFDRIPVSPGVWGLGPELPRQSPVIVVLAVVSGVVDGTVLVAALMVATVATAFVGVARLSRPTPWHARVAAGLLYSVSPWLVTRIAIGHLGLAFAAALLPWVLPTLLRPASDLRRTLLAAAALGLGGFFGGSLALLVIGVGVVTSRGRHAFRIALVWLVSQLPWIIPGLIVGLSAPNIAGAEYFGTSLASAGDVARLILGYGFWQRGNQLGLGSAMIPVAALLVLALGLSGWSRLPDRWGKRAAVLAGVALLVVTASSLPLVDDLFETLSSSLPGAVLREPQRVLVLFLVWLAPAAAFGIDRISARDARAGMLASLCCATIVVVAISPALWGAGGRLDPVDAPHAWAEVRDSIDADPGTTLALPWNQYIDVTIADGRRTYHPINTLIGSDVLNSSDPEFGPAISEAVDRRSPTVEQALVELDRGGQLSSSLSAIGVRWVVVVTGVDDARYEPLSFDQGLRVRVGDESIVLYEVLEWRGRAQQNSGAAVDVDVVVPPLVRLGSGETTWYAPGAPGWVRGWTSARITDAGVMLIPAGSGPAWYWPALLALAGHAITAGAVMIALVPGWWAAWAARWRRIVARRSSDACEPV